MNTIEQLVEALKAVYLTCDWHGDDGKDAMQLASKAIAAGEAELKREPVKKETHCPHHLPVYEYCQECDEEVTKQLAREETK